MITIMNLIWLCALITTGWVCYGLGIKDGQKHGYQAGYLERDRHIMDKLRFQQRMRNDATK